MGKILTFIGWLFFIFGLLSKSSFSSIIFLFIAIMFAHSAIKEGKDSKFSRGIFTVVFLVEAIYFLLVLIFTFVFFH